MSFVHSHFLCKNLDAVCADYFWRYVKNFFCYFFQKQASKDHLKQGNLLKTTLLNEKQSNLERKCTEVYLYSATNFHLEHEVISQNILLLFKTNEKVYLLRSKKLNIK